MEIALATHTSPAAWWDEDDATLATALELLAAAADRATKATGKPERRAHHG